MSIKNSGNWGVVKIVVFSFFVIMFFSSFVYASLPITCGEYYTVMTKGDGSLWAWGYNRYGVLGDGTTNSSSIPTKIGTDTDWKVVACRVYHTIAIKNDGTLWTWGLNNYGQLGDGTTIDRTIPIKIGTDTDWKSIACGEYYTIALKNDGTLWTWGLNNYGQLGDGTTIDKTIPTKIGTDTDWKTIACGYSHTIAIKNDGTLWTWGLNNYGQLGDGTKIDKNTPTYINVCEGLYSSIACGKDFTIAIGGYYLIKLNGFPKLINTLWTWGRNNYGQLGDGTTTDRSVPTRAIITELGYDSKWQAIACGEDFSIAVKNDNSLWGWGNNAYKQLGFALGNYVTIPTTINDIYHSPFGLTDPPIHGIVCGKSYSILVKDDGNLILWGTDSYYVNPGNLEITKSITSSAGANGKIIPSSTDIFFNNSNQIYTIIPNEGYHVADVVVDEISQGAITNYTFANITHNHTISASFAIDSTTYTITSSANTNVTISPLGSIIVNNNATQVFKITPSIGCFVSDVVVDGISKGSMDRFTFTNVTANHTISASIEKYLKIACGKNYTVEIRNDGTLWAWGYNGKGQLGDGTTTDKLIPTKIGSDTNWATIACGESHTIALKNDGTLWAWGFNSDGQLGDGTTTDKLIPTKIGTSTDWKAIACGQYHGIALKSDGTLCAWGRNENGQLGDGTAVNKLNPIKIGTDTDWKAIASEGYHTIAIKNDGTLWAWGNDYNGELGDGKIENANPIPSKIGTATDWKSIACGGFHTIALKNDGTLWAWGYNYYGQLGDGTTTDKSIPTKIGSAIDWKAITCGYYYTMAIKNNGELWAWGDNLNSELGDGTKISKSIPTKIGTATYWMSMACGWYHSIIKKIDDTLWSCGYNGSGQLGDGATTSKSIPTKITNNITSNVGVNGTISPLASNTFSNDSNQIYFISAFTGYHITDVLVDGVSQGAITSYTFSNITTDHTISASFAIDSTTYTITSSADANGSIFPSGSVVVNNNATQIFKIISNIGYYVSDVLVDGISKGAIGSVTFTNITTNHTISASFVAENIEKKIACGNNYSVMIKSDGTLWSWGYNYYGELGDGTTNNKNTPTKIGTDTNWKAIACGEYHIIALKTDGTLWAWGYNNSGQLGDGTTNSKNTPTKIGTATDWKAIASGGYYTVAIKNDGTLWAWGSNGSGQLGDGTTNNKNIPTKIGTATDWKVIACGGYHTIALKTDGTLWAWGSNGSGELGDGTTSSKIIPTKIGTATDWKAIAGGLYYTVAIKNDGTLWSWGNNKYGQLGDGTTTDKVIPTKVGTDSDWKTIACGFIFYSNSQYTIAIKNDGTLWSWGANSYGKLGDGTTIDKLIPTKIGTDTDWKSIACGLNHTLAIKNDDILWAWGLNSSGQLGDSTGKGRYVPTQITYIITSSSGINGSISPLDTTMVNYGNNQTYTITPNNGYHITDLLVDGISQGAITSYTFVNVRSNHTINANFAVDSTTYTITASCGSSGTILPSGSFIVKNNETQIFKITSKVGYDISDVLVDGVSQGAITNYTFKNIVANHTISISFSINKERIIANGYYFTITRKSDGTLWASGDNKYGQLGDGTTTAKSIPTKIGTDTDWATIACGYYHAIALKIDGTLWVWGSNSYGQLGDGTTTSKLIPTKIGTSNDWKAIACADSHTIAIKNDGTLWAWGDNYYGQLGDGTTTSRYTPTKIGIDSGWKSISCGLYYTMAIKNDGTLWSWGNNYYGQLGDETSIDKLNPTKIGTDTDWKTIACRYQHTLALKTDGTLWAWGKNYSGQLGVGSTYVDSTGPTKIGTDTDWASIACGYNYSAAKKADGTLWAWGDNYYGQLGDGTTTSRYTPTKIGIDSGWKSISCGYYHTGAINSDDILYAWGSNGYGQLGDGTNISKFTPIIINGFTTYTITSSSDTNGSISPSNITIVNYGSNKTYIITPNAGYHISNVLVDGVSQGVISSYTFTNVKSNHTISASFAIDTFKIIASSGANGSISQYGTTTVNYGSNQIYTITPNTNYYISNVLVDGVLKGAIQSYSFNNITTNHTISSTFTNIKANFKSNTTILYLPGIVNFYDSSKGTITSWQWDFGDGSTSNIQNPSHKYNDNGVYTVSLKVGGISEYDNCLKQNYIQIFTPSLQAPSYNNFGNKNMDGEAVTYTPWLSVNNSSYDTTKAYYKTNIRYSFEIYKDANFMQKFDSSAEIQEGKNTTIWLVSKALEENTSYWWRAWSYVGEIKSNPMNAETFFVNKINESPSKVTISTPPDGSSVSSQNVKLEVNNAIDLDKDKLSYNFKLYDKNGLKYETTGIPEGLTGTTNWSISQALEDNSWYGWISNAVDIHGLEGECSDTTRFFVNTANNPPTTPVLDIPVDSKEIVSQRPLLTVKNSQDLDGDMITYFFEIDETNSFNSNKLQKSSEVSEGAITTSWQPEQLNDNTNFYWRARSFDGAEYSAWMNAGFFVNTINDAPTVPVILSPKETIVSVLTPELKINSSSDIDKDLITYEYNVYDISRNLVTSAIGKGTSWIVDKTLDDNSKYFWQAQAKDDNNLAGGWTDTTWFRVNQSNDAPSAPQTIRPLNNSTVATQTPELEIKNASDLDGDKVTYHFQVSGDSLFTDIVAEIDQVAQNNQGNTIWKVTKDLIKGKKYFWRVQSHDGTVYGSFSETFSFTIESDKIDTPVPSETKKSGCLITSKTSQREMVNKLNEIKDQILTRNKFGEWLIGTYYKISPDVVRVIK